MGSFIETLANQSQSVCTGLESITMKKSVLMKDWILGKVEGIYENMAALNGTINKFYRDYYQKKIEN